MQLAGIGLGAYPTDSYFDPGRPDWLPYWIDTPTESEMKWGSPSLTGQAAAVAGYLTGQVANVAGDVAGSAAGGVARSLSVQTILILGAGLFALYLIKK